MTEVVEVIDCPEHLTVAGFHTSNWPGKLRCEGPNGSIEIVDLASNRTVTAVEERIYGSSSGLGR